MKKTWMLTARVAAIVALVAAAAGGADADGRQKDRLAPLVGAWNLTVLNPFSPEPEPLFPAVWVFHAGGTITERTANGIPTGPPGTGITSGNGVWKRIGPRRYAGMIEGFIDSEVDGTFDLKYRVRVTVEVRGHELEGTASLDFFTLSDGEPQPGPPVPFPVQATRMWLIRE